MAERKDGGPAFPFNEKHDDGSHYYSNAGMSLRDWFAGQALAGMLAYTGSYGLGNGPGETAVRAYEIADAMLAARGGQS